MANEVFVANLQPLKPGEESLAFSCALPMNAKGLRVLSRKSYEAAAVSIFDNPISSRFDENDAIFVQAPGQIETVDVKPGDHVEQGQRIAKLQSFFCFQPRVTGRSRTRQHALTHAILQLLL